MNTPDRPLIAKLDVRSGNFGPIDLPLTAAAIDELWDSNQSHALACFKELAPLLGYTVLEDPDWEPPTDWGEATKLAHDITTAGERCYILHPD